MNDPQLFGQPGQQQPGHLAAQPQGQQPVQYEAQPSSSGKRIAIILGSIFAVAMLLVGGMLFYVSVESHKLKSTFNNISSTLP